MDTAHKSQLICDKTKYKKTCPIVVNTFVVHSNTNTKYFWPQCQIPADTHPSDDWLALSSQKNFKKSRKKSLSLLEKNKCFIVFVNCLWTWKMSWKVEAKLFWTLRMVAFCKNLPSVHNQMQEQQMLSLLLRELAQPNNLSKHTRALHQNMITEWLPNTQSSLSEKFLRSEVIQDIWIFLDIAGYFGLGGTMVPVGGEWNDWSETEVLPIVGHYTRLSYNG